MLRNVLATLALPCVFSTLSFAARLHVPGDYDELQAAIDQALPGDTIVVHGGVFDPVTIDKPLTIVGEPRPTIRFDVTTSPGEFRPAHLRLEGDGTGIVVLRNLQIGPGDLRFSQVNVDPAITATGFEELHVHDCDVQAAYFFVPAGDCCFDGKAALSTDIPQVFVSHSILRASPSDSGVCDYLPSPAEAGIEAAGSTVVLLDSTVVGGGQAYFCTPESCFDPSVVEGTYLAPGVVAAALFQAGASISGGSVGFWGYQVNAPYGQIFECGSGLQAAALSVGQDVSLPNKVQAFTDLSLGQQWVLFWSASGSFSTLLLSTDALSPPVLTTTGWLFLDMQGALPPRTVFGAGIHEFRFTPPATALGLIGVEVFAQVFDGGVGMSDPVADCIGPRIVSTLLAPTVVR